MLTFLLLSGCFDAADTHLTLDVKSGEAHVVERMHNAWPNTVDCGEKEGVTPTVDACVTAIREYLGKEVEDITTGGGKVAKAGIVLDAGKLDFYYDYTTPPGGKSLSDLGLRLYWGYARTPADVKAARPGKKQLTLLVTPQDEGTSTLDVTGKYQLLDGVVDGSKLSIYTFSGSNATLDAHWVHAAATADAPAPGAWLAQREGLEAALQASGMVVTP